MRLVEPFAVVDIFTSGVAKVEILRGGNMRVTYFTDGTDEDGAPEMAIAAKVIFPIHAVDEARRLVNLALISAAAISDENGVAAH